MSEEQPFTYRNPGVLAAWAIGLSGTAIALHGLTLTGMVYYLKFYDDLQSGQVQTEGSPQTAAFFDRLLAIVGPLTSAAAIAAIVVFLIWLYRASANVHALGAQDLSASPGFSVGSYFIPFANFVLPPINMGQLWRASLYARQWRQQNGTILIAIWWTLQIASSICGAFALFWKPDPSQLEELRNFVVFLIASELINIGFRISLIVLVRAITRNQGGQARSPDLAAVFA